MPTIGEFINQKLGTELDKYGYEARNLGSGRDLVFIYDNDESREQNEDWGINFLDIVKSIYVVFNEMMSPTLGRWDYIDNPHHLIYIYLYTHRLFSSESNKGLRRTYFQGFNKASTFKTEDYNVIPPMADFRRTIWWQPDITTDEQAKPKWNSLIIPPVRRCISAWRV